MLYSMQSTLQCKRGTEEPILRILSYLSISTLRCKRTEGKKKEKERKRKGKGGGKKGKKRNLKVLNCNYLLNYVL